MTYEQLVQIFQTAALAYAPVLPALPLNFHYDKVWYNNGAASNKYPSMLFECSPDFELTGVQSNNRTGMQTFTGKLFFYDTFYESEKAAQPTVDEATWKKQSALNELALKVIGNINGQTLTTPMQTIEWGKGFFGIDVHNPRLVQVFIPFKAIIRSECTPLTV